MSPRRRSREMALQMLFQADQGGSSCREVVASYRPGDLRDVATVGAGAGGADAERVLQYARSLATGTMENLEEIDTLIAEQAENWRMERMPAVDRNVLRLAVYEFLFEEDVPKLVVLDEAIELAKKYGSEQSGAFVNGLLDGLLKQREFPGTLT